MREPDPFLRSREKTKYQSFANAEAKNLQIAHSMKVVYSEDIDERGVVLENWAFRWLSRKLRF
jgi:hypothetical protein